MIEQSGIISSSILPLSGSNSSRYTPLIHECPISRSNFAMRSNTSGKSILILFQYPIPPFTQPIQLLLLYPKSYISGLFIPRLSSIACASDFDSIFSINGNSCSNCNILSNNLPALFCSLKSNPQIYVIS